MRAQLRIDRGAQGLQSLRLYWSIALGSTIRLDLVTLLQRLSSLKKFW